MHEDSLLSVILPAFNEEEALPITVQNIIESLDRHRLNYEVIVVNDGSTDSTKHVALELEKRYLKKMRVLHHEKNKGYGAAIQTGMQDAKGELISYLDADNQFDPEDFPVLLALMDSHDLVTGIRTPRSEGMFRILLSRAYNAYARTILGIPFHDVNCAFKVMRRSVLDSIDLKSTQYCFSGELLARADRAGMCMAEVPVRHTARVAGQSKVDCKHIARTLRELLRIRRILPPRQY